MPIASLQIKDPQNPTLPLQSDLWNQSANLENDGAGNNKLVIGVYHPEGAYAVENRVVLHSTQNLIKEFTLLPAVSVGFTSKLVFIEVIDSVEVTKHIDIAKDGSVSVIFDGA